MYEREDNDGTAKNNNDGVEQGDFCSMVERRTLKNEEQTRSNPTNGMRRGRHFQIDDDVFCFVSASAQKIIACANGFLRRDMCSKARVPSVV